MIVVLMVWTYPVLEKLSKRESTHAIVVPNACGHYPASVRSTANLTPSCLQRDRKIGPPGAVRALIWPKDDRRGACHGHGDRSSLAGAEASRATAADPCCIYREQFPILARTNYLISNSLGAVPAAVAASLQSYYEAWATRGVRAWEESLVDAGRRPRRPGRAADRRPAGRGRLSAQRDPGPCRRLQRVRLLRADGQDRHRRDALPLDPLPDRPAAPETRPRSTSFPRRMASRSTPSG